MLQSLIIKNKFHLYTKGYWDYISLLPALIDRPSSTLMIGLGGGTIPYQIDNIFGDKVRMLIIESNEEVIELHKKFIGQELINSWIMLGDGIDYIENSANLYHEIFDIIIFDAFKEAQTPSEFKKLKLFQQAHNLLKQDGIFAMNQISDENGIINKDLNETIGKVFHRYNILVNCKSTQKKINNLIIGTKAIPKYNVETNAYKNNRNEFVFKEYGRVFYGK